MAVAPLGPECDAVLIELARKAQADVGGVEISFVADVGLGLAVVVTNKTIKRGDVATEEPECADPDRPEVYLLQSNRICPRILLRICLGLESAQLEVDVFRDRLANGQLPAELILELKIA